MIGSRDRPSCIVKNWEPSRHLKHGVEPQREWLPLRTVGSLSKGSSPRLDSGIAASSLTTITTRTPRLAAMERDLF